MLSSNRNIHMYINESHGAARRRRMALRAQSYQGTCVVCGAEFPTSYAYTKYCGPECRKQAHRDAIRDREPLPRRQSLPPAAVGIETRAWHGTPIQRRENDGWVNATAMCQAGGKRWNDYIRLDRTSEYVCALQHAITGQTPCAAAVAGFPATLPAVIKTRQGGAPHLQGTWVHPRLAVDLARWISPAFAVWMDGWFLETIASGTTPHHHQPTTPGITITAPTEREAMQLWQSAIETETTRALRLTLGVRGRTDHALRMRNCDPWRFVAC